MEGEGEGEGKRQSALEAIDQKMKINASAAATCASDIYIIKPNQIPGWPFSACPAFWLLLVCVM